MDDLKPKGCARILLLAAAQAVALNLYAGGSGLNTVVVINQSSPNSIALGNYYCERRQIPPENVLRISWPGDNILWLAAEFQTNLLDPLRAMLASRQLINQIEYVVLSMDIPYQTANATNVSAINGTTSALFYGLKTDSGPGGLGVTNSYAASELPFSLAKPLSAPGYSWLTTMLTAGSLAQAKALVDQGVTSDQTFPTRPVLLEKSTDVLRNVRYHGFDNTIFNTRLRGNYTTIRTNSDSVAGLNNLLGIQTGLYQFTISPGTFVAGAMADSLTSYGGVIFGHNDQTSLLEFIHAGAAGGYGTVTEPTPNPDKFPSPQNYFYQARGFSLAECYYQSLVAPFQGIVVGEPLAAPFQRTAVGDWQGVVSNAVLSGLATLTVRFDAVSADRPLQQVDLFVDGKLLRTLTNLPPQAGNELRLNLNGYELTYTVPPNATLASVASGLTGLINVPATINLTKTIAIATGDRIELRSEATNRLSKPLNLRSGAGGTPPLATSNSPIARVSIGSAPLLSTFLNASRPTFLDSSAYGIKGCNVSGILQVGTWLQIVVTKTNGARVTLSVTNQSINGTLNSLTAQLMTRINSTAALQGADGVIAEDMADGFFDSANFNCRARTSGFRAARIRFQLSGTPGSFVLTPPGEAILDDNLADLQPRNHLYVTAGVTNVDVGFSLDTTSLPDGFHELTAVAYEGSSVRTQTRASLPVRIQNSPLDVSLVLLDLPDPSPAQGVYHIQVSANTNDVSSIRLYSTGGVLDVVNNQATATFTVNGAALGPGSHPFYAVVQTSAGLTYRTQTQRVRLTP